MGTSHSNDHKEKGYETAEQIAKTPADISFIKRALEKDPYFACLDASQEENFVQCSRLISYEPGETIYKQGGPGDLFYIVAEGDCEQLWLVDPKSKKYERQDLKHAGDSFGGYAFLFDNRRCSTVVATTPTKLWILDRESLYDVLDSPHHRSIYEKYATKILQNGSKVMTMSDFVKASTHSDDPEKYIEIASLYKVFSKQHQKHDDAIRDVSYKDFTLFNMLMTRPDPQFEIAFMLVDEDRKGYVDAYDIRDFLFDLILPFNATFDFNCDLMRRYFGLDGKRGIRIDEFTAFFCQLQIEIGQQAFIAATRGKAKDKKMKVLEHLDNETFVSVLSKYNGSPIPEELIERIAYHYKAKNNPDKIPPMRTFGDFVAHQHVLSHLPAICNVITSAARAKGSEKTALVSKDDFKMAAKILLKELTSRIDADVVFQIFDIDHDGYIGRADLQTILGDSFNQPIRAATGKDGKITLVPPPGAMWHPIQVEEKPKPFFQKTQEELVEFAENAALGAIAGGLGAAFVYPIDVIKTRLQNQPYSMYTGARDCWRKIVESEGRIGLFRGLVPQMIGIWPEKAVKLVANDFLRDAFTNKDKVTGKDDIFFPLEVLAGLGAGFAQVMVTNPLEIVKIRLQVQGETEALMIAAGKPVLHHQSALDIVRELGLSGLYKGTAACLLRDVPFSGIYFPCFAWGKKYLAADNDGKVEPHHILLAGGMAGIPAASLVTPADVIKTRLQVIGGNEKYKGVADCFWKIVNKEGVRALFRGGFLRVFRTTPQFAVTLMSYEFMHNMLGLNIAHKPPTVGVIAKDGHEVISDSYRKQHVESRAASTWGMVKPNRAASELFLQKTA